MRRAILVLGALLGCASGVRAQDAGPPAPPPVKKPRPPAMPPVEGIVWERDLDAGLRRSIQEGRPIYLCVNALVDEGETGNRLSFQQYGTKEVGDASRGFVCFVGNPNPHEDKKLPDGTVVCSRYGNGTCKAHQDALGWGLRRFSGDGSTLISPSHFVVDPDGALAYHGDYMQSRLEPRGLETLLVRLSPRIALRTVWAARDTKMEALSKAKTEELGKLASEWVATGDPYAVAGCAAALEQESDSARRRALMAACKGTGALGAAVLFDAVEAATSTPAADPDAALAWVAAAFDVDVELAVWAATRAIARGGDMAFAGSVITQWLKARGADDVTALPASDRAHLGEALLRWDVFCVTAMKPGATLLSGEAAGLLPAVRVTRARAMAGRGPLILSGPDSGSRDARSQALRLAKRDEILIGGAKEAVLAALKDPVEEIRVAAALALRRAGDPAGADVLLSLVGDPVEGPEIRAGLAALLGEDLGGDPSAWATFVRSAEGGGK